MNGIAVSDYLAKSVIIRKRCRLLQNLYRKSVLFDNRNAVKFSKSQLIQLYTEVFLVRSMLFLCRFLMSQ